MFYILIFFQCVFSKMFAETVGAPKCFIPWPKWYNWGLFPWISPWFFFDTIGCGINNLLQFSVHISFFLSFISNLKAFSRCSHDWFINIDTFLSLMCVRVYSEEFALIKIFPYHSLWGIQFGNRKGNFSLGNRGCIREGIWQGAVLL